MIPYTIIRSSRRTLSIQISRDGEIIARAPHRLSISHIESFIVAKEDWIEKHKQKIQDTRQKIKKRVYTATEIVAMKERLGSYIIPRVRELWEGKDLPKYTSIKITKSEGRWGSCSAKDGLCFSYRLAEYLLGKELFIDAIIVHELAHLREKNHQKPFWNLVYSMIPRYEAIMKTTLHYDE